MSYVSGRANLKEKYNDEKNDDDEKRWKSKKEK